MTPDPHKNASAADPMPSDAGRGTEGIARLEGRVLPLLLLAATFLVFWPVHRFEFISFDDPLYVAQNPQVLSGLTLENIGWAFTTFHAQNWHPLTWLSLMADAQFFAADPAVFHLVNVLWHTVNVGLVFWLLRLLTGRLGPSLVVAALFALHPLHVESVAWVSERKDVLSTFFLLLTLGAYGYYVRARTRGETQFSRRAYAGALGLFALGLMSKPMLVTVPFLLLLLDYWPLARLKAATWKNLVLEKVPFLVLTILSSVITFAAQQQGGAVRSLVQFSFGARLENAAVAYTHYLGKMIWPADLAIFYPHPGDWPTATVAGAGVVLVGVTVVALGLRRRAPFLLVGWLWYLGTLVPVIGLVQVGEQAMADRYTYVPLLGIFIALAWGAGERFGRLSHARLIGYGLMLPVVALCGLLSRNQLLHWRDDETLFRHALTVTRNNPLAHNNLADALLAKGRAADAVPHYRETIRLNPSYAHAYNNLGTALVALNEVEEAREQFRAAAKLDMRFVEPRMNLADIEAAANRLDEAVQLYNEALQIAPNSIPIRLKLSQALTRAGKSDEAIKLLLKIIEQAPDAPAAHYYLGRALVLRGDLKLGAMSFQAALRLDPSLAPAHLNLAETLSRLGEYEDAGLHFQEALRLDPGHADTRYAYGKYLAGRGLIDQARQQYEEALRLAPGHKAASEQLEAIRSR